MKRNIPWWVLVLLAVIGLMLAWYLPSVLGQDHAGVRVMDGTLEAGKGYAPPPLPHSEVEGPIDTNDFCAVCPPARTNIAFGWNLVPYQNYFYLVQTSANLKTWTTFATLPNTQTNFSDWLTLRLCFYRVRSSNATAFNGKGWIEP